VRWSDIFRTSVCSLSASCSPGGRRDRTGLRGRVLVGLIVILAACLPPEPGAAEAVAGPRPIPDVAIFVPDARNLGRALKSAPPVRAALARTMGSSLEGLALAGLDFLSNYAMGAPRTAVTRALPHRFLFEILPPESDDDLTASPRWLLHVWFANSAQAATWRNQFLPRAAQRLASRSGTGSGSQVIDGVPVFTFTPKHGRAIHALILDDRALLGPGDPETLLRILRTGRPADPGFAPPSNALMAWRIRAARAVRETIG
jgi:hypothetical protein